MDASQDTRRSQTHNADRLMNALLEHTTVMRMLTAQILMVASPVRASIDTMEMGPTVSRFAARFVRMVECVSDHLCVNVHPAMKEMHVKWIRMNARMERVNVQVNLTVSTSQAAITVIVILDTTAKLLSTTVLHAQILMNVRQQIHVTRVVSVSTTRVHTSADAQLLVAALQHVVLNGARRVTELRGIRTCVRPVPARLVW